MPAAAIRKLDLDPAATMNQLFDLYDRSELKLTRSPDKTLLFQTHELRDEDVQSIGDDITRKVDKRLADLDAFVKVIEAGVAPTRALQEHFGGT